MEDVDLDYWFEVGLGHLLDRSGSVVAVECLSGSGYNVDFLESQSEVVVSDAPRVLGVAEFGDLVLVGDPVAGEPLPVCFKPGSDKDVPPLVARVVAGSSGRDESASHLYLGTGASEILE